MTREEFDRDVTTYSDLFDLAYENNLEEILENVMCEDTYNEDVSEYLIPEWVREYSWTEVRDRLYDLPDGYDYYYRNDYGDYIGTNDGDDTFEDFKDQFRTYMENDGLFDDESDEIIIQQPPVENSYAGVRLTGVFEEEDLSLTDDMPEISEFFTPNFMKRDEFIVDEA